MPSYRSTHAGVAPREWYSRENTTPLSPDGQGQRDRVCEPIDPWLDSAENTAIRRIVYLVTQIQFYCAVSGRGYTGTATTWSSTFGEHEPGLGTLLSAVVDA